MKDKENSKTREQLQSEIEKMTEDWNSQDCPKKEISSKSLTPSFVLLMIELLIAIMLFKLLI